MNATARPASYELELLAQVPPSLLVDAPSDWALKRWGDGGVGCFLEGPVIMPNGDILMCDLAHGRILRLDADGKIDVLVAYDGSPNGLAHAGDGRLVVADVRLGLLSLNADSPSEPEVIAADCAGQPFLGLNDLVVDLHGGITVTDQGDSDLQEPVGRVLHRSTANDWTVVAHNLPSPNGLAIDGDDLLVALTRDNAIWKGRMGSDGRVVRMGRLLSFSGGIGPDGIVCGPNGLLFVARLGLGAVSVHDRRGRSVAQLHTDLGDRITNVAVDWDADRLVVTEAESNSILCFDISRIPEGQQP